MPLETRRILILYVLVATLFIVTISALALLSDEAEAGGNGNYPPPASGNWYINQATSVWQEKIELKGNLYISAPLTLNMVNLTFNCSWNLQYELRVYSSGSLQFTNGNITATDKAYHYRFRVYNTTSISSSEISEMYYGIQVYTKQFTLKDNKVFDSYGYGVSMSLVYTLTGNVLIKGNEFINNRNYGIYIYQNSYVNRVDYDAVMTGDITIQENKFRDNLGGGIYAYRYMYTYYSHETKMFTNLTIEGNEMVANRGYSIYVYTRLYNYQGGDDGKITYSGAINVNNNTVKDNSGYYAIYYYNDIDIYYGSDALIDSDVNMVGNTITGNKGAYALYFNNNIYEYYGRDAKVRIDLRMEANNISSNGGHGVYVNSVTNTNHGDKGVCTNDGDIVFKDNNIMNNQGSGVYFYRYAYSSYAAYSSINGNTTFTGNRILNNQGYGGAYLYTYSYKNRGDPNGTANIQGTVRFSSNTFEGNLGYGAYVLRYTRTYYGGDSTIIGDVTFTGNTINKNTGYGGYVVYDAYKQEGGSSGNAKVISNATFNGNTMSGNSGYHGFYYNKQARCYSSSYSSLNGTVTAEGNTIEDNKGYGIYINAYAYNNRGALGNTFITGDIWIRNNTIRRNNGGGVYLRCYSYSYVAKSADIYQNITFSDNTVTNNGFSGFVITVNAYSNRAVGGDTHVVGRISYLNNVVNYNQNYGIYFYRVATAYYTDGTEVYVRGDMLVEGNEVNSNVYYAIYMVNYVNNYQAGLAGHCELDSDYLFRNNTVKNNRYWAAMYLYRRIYSYYTGTAVMDSDLVLEDNVVTGNWGTGVYTLDQSDQYYYGGTSDPDRGSFTQKGRMVIQRNSIDTNAGTGLWLNSTINAEVRTIEAAPRIVDNSISYNGGDFALFCDLRDITEPITIENNTLEHNVGNYVALIHNSGTAPDMNFIDNLIRHNDVTFTILGLVIGDGDYNATFKDNNVSYNDAGQFVLAFLSRGRITVTQNEFFGNVNATDAIMVAGASTESTISITDNVVMGNSGNGITVNTLGKLTVRDNTVRGNSGSGVIAITDVGATVIEADITVTKNIISDNGGNGVWSVSMSSLVVTDNVITRNGLAGIKVNAMKEMPDLSDNTIRDNKWGVQLSGDNLAPLTQTYTFNDLVILDSEHEGLYAEDLTIQLRSCTITGSTDADLAVRRARIDCYSTNVGYASGHVYETGHIKVWWRVDIDVKWQSGVAVPRAHVVLTSDTDNRTYREMDTDVNGHIDPFNVEEWSMEDIIVNRWSPYRCTGSKNTESTTQVEKVNRSRNILIILMDVHVPTMTITEPAEGALLNYTIVRVVGTAYDGGSGLTTVRIRLDNEDWTDLGKVTAFNKLMAVPDGTHLITVQGEDVAGMLGNATINLTIDTLPPQLLLVSPQEGHLTNTSLLEVEGRVQEVGLEIVINDVPQTIGSDNVFKETVRLFEGPNLIKVWAQDRAGNIRWLFVNVTLDTLPPILSVDSPPDYYLTSEQSIDVVGRSEAGAEVFVGPFITTVEADGTFSLPINLTEGTNLITVTARDPAGNPSLVFLHVTLDTIAPMVTIEEPVDGLLTKDDKIRVAGSVEMEDGLVISVGGSVAFPSEGRYESTVDLVEGTNLITVIARDAAGNEAHTNVTVIRRTIPPKLDITDPAYDFMVTNLVHFIIRGTTDADVDLEVAGTDVAVEPDGNFSAEVQLQSGENIIAIRASDILGNVANAVVHLILDTEPPSLVVEYPFDGLVTEEDSVNVSGRTDVGAYLYIEGEEVALDDKGRFYRWVPLKMGRQNFTVVSTDLAGNEASVSLFVERYEPTEPFDPTSPSSTGGSTGLILAILLVLIVLGVLGYMYLQKRRRLMEE
jgi:hypothetical protein